MRAILILAAAATILLAGCASAPQQSASPGDNVSTNESCPGSGVPIATHQIGNGAGDPTGNTGTCPTTTPSAGP